MGIEATLYGESYMALVIPSALPSLVFVCCLWDLACVWEASHEWQTCIVPPPRLLVSPVLSQGHLYPTYGFFDLGLLSSSSSVVSAVSMAARSSGLCLNLCQMLSVPAYHAHVSVTLNLRFPAQLLLFTPPPNTKQALCFCVSHKVNVYNFRKKACRAGSKKKVELLIC